MAVTTTMNMFDTLQVEDLDQQSDNGSESSIQIILDNPRELDDNEFPMLGSKQETKKPEKSVSTITGKVDSSHIVELKRERLGGSSDERTKAFVRLQDKEGIAQRLKATRPCQYVIKNGDGTFGVCYREVCTFAHSLAELQLPPCAFGDECNRRHGTKDRKTGKINPDTKCLFCHPGETSEEFYTRTGRTKPKLPATSEQSRQPKLKRSKPIEKPRPQLPDDPQIEPALKEYVENAGKQVPGHKRSKAMEGLETKSEPVIITVPKDMVIQATELAISRGLTNFQVIPL